MQTTLNAEQVAAYRRDGFVLQRGFLNADETAELKEAVLASVQKMGKRKVSDGGSKWEEGESFYDKVFTQRLNLWRINDVVKRYLVSNPELGRMLCELEGVDGMRVWHDQTLIKEPYGNPTAWHLDNPYWSFSTRHAISIWIALEDATLENGCMWFVPGSHEHADFKGPGIGQNMVELFNFYPKMRDVDPVSAPMKAGDCSFHNGLTAHGAGANMTRRRRIAMTCAYMPMGCTFNGRPNILPEAYLGTLKEGDVMENDDWNPVVGR